MLLILREKQDENVCGLATIYADGNRDIYRKLMSVYKESNRENIRCFFPDCTNEEEGLKKTEESFVAYLREEFFVDKNNVCCIWESGGEWVSALRLYDVSAHPILSALSLPGFSVAANAPSAATEEADEPCYRAARAFYIEALETRPDGRKRGYGSALLSATTEFLKKDGGFILRDCVGKRNIASLATHKKCGFFVEREIGAELSGEANPHAFGMIFRYNINV